jgi:hypothetical protein
MQRLRVHRQRAEEHIVHFSDGAADRVFKDLTLFKLLEVQSGHRPSPSLCRPVRRQIDSVGNSLDRERGKP